MMRYPLAALVLAICPAGAAAQTATSSNTQGNNPVFDGTAVGEGPAGSADNAITGIDFNLEISEDESKTSVQFGGYRVHNVSPPGGRSRQAGRTWMVKLAAPIGGLDDLTSRSTLEALGNGPELSFAYSWFGFGSANVDSREYRELTGPGSVAQTRCNLVSNEAGRAVGDAIAGAAQPEPEVLLRQRAMEAAARIAPAAPESVVAAAIAAALQARANQEDPTIAAISAANSEAVGPDDIGACAPPGPPETAFAKRYSDQSNSAINRMVFSAGWRLGVEGRVGINRFEFIDAASLEKHEPSKVQFGAALFGAHYLASGQTALLGRVEYQNAFESAEAGLVCKPLVVDPDTDCVPGVATPPTNFERVNLSAEVRHIFDAGWKAGNFAVSPKLTYDTLNDEFGAVLPIYFVPRDGGAFAPGASLIYSSVSDKVSFGAFLRTSF